MENKVERRWGIVLLSVVLFICTTILTMAFRQKTSLYYVLWLMVGFYAYKSNLVAIKKWIVLWNVTELVVIVTSYLFIGDNSLDLVKGIKDKSAGNSLTVFAIMLAPSALIYFYCNKEMKPEMTSTNLNNTNPQFNYENTNIKKENTNQKNEIEMNNITKKINEEELWEIIVEEFDSTKRKKGLYAKLFAETNGDEIAAKIAYYKTRVEEIKNSKQN